MKLTEEIKQEIDAMTYVQMLEGWRFNPVGHPFHQGEVGTYYANRMRHLARNGANHVEASKIIGWNNRKET